MSANDNSNRDCDDTATIAESSLNDSTCTGLALSMEEIENARQKETERVARQQAKEQIEQSQLQDNRSEYWQRHFDQQEVDSPYSENDDDDDDGDDEGTDHDESSTSMYEMPLSNTMNEKSEKSEKISFETTPNNNNSDSNNIKGSKRQQRQSRRNPSAILPGAVRISMVGAATPLKPGGAIPRSPTASTDSADREIMINAKVRSRSLRQSTMSDSDEASINSSTPGAFAASPSSSSQPNVQSLKGRVSIRERRKAASSSLPSSSASFSSTRQQEENDELHEMEESIQLSNNNNDGASILNDLPVEHPRFLPSNMLHQHGAMAINGPGHDLQQQQDNNNNSHDDDNNNTIAIDVEQPQQQQQHDSANDGLAVADVVDESELIQQAQDMLRQEMRENTAEAEIVDEKPRQRLIVGSILCCLVALAILVGVVVRVVRNNSDSQSPSDRVILATSSPTSSLIPTAAPSDMPSPSPSVAPSSIPSHTPSSSPSALPTMAPTNPDNESCEMAIPFDEGAPGNIIFQGDLHFSNTLQHQASCFVTSTISPSLDFLTGGPARWYSFIGTNTPIALRLCSRQDSLLGTLFTDSCDSLKTLCPIVGLHQYTRIVPSDTSDTACPKQTLLVLDNSISNRLYRVGIQYMFTLEENRTLPEILSPFSLMQSDGSYTLELTQSNYFCEGALPIIFEPGARFNLDISGTTKGAPTIQEYSCEYFSDINGTPGVWYEYYAFEEYVTFSACSKTPGITNQISVFVKNNDIARQTNDDDDAGCFDYLSCVAGTTNSCEEPVSFLAKLDTTYYILVSSSDPIGDAFVLSAVPPIPRAQNCTGAFEVQDDDIYPGAVFEYYSERFVTFTSACLSGASLSGEPYIGVWYKFEGRNSTLEISTDCNGPQGSFGVHVFRDVNTTSSCMELVCVGYLDSCEQRHVGNANTTLSFFTDPEYTYYVKANGDMEEFVATYGFVVVDEYSE